MPRSGHDNALLEQVLDLQLQLPEVQAALEEAKRRYNAAKAEFNQLRAANEHLTRQVAQLQQQSDDRRPRRRPQKPTGSTPSTSHPHLDFAPIPRAQMSNPELLASIKEAEAQLVPLIRRRTELDQRMLRLAVRYSNLLQQNRDLQAQIEETRRRLSRS
ncbi:calcium binding and coiled-coil (CALCOCO1)-like domain-containing protein [Purpureocillium lilacinum]|uniref:Calcium binding and coiled-coil (CALCOCO1)-like domain-containing protein n=1 Tax=Purpureocillium lilacinum TaxID=33203 RepID=A0A179GL78_PURLI|nr:calcium binding and coiled-coil (CALCOCO1)-like domain-containing protein [Purpureocillium lilacinum]OAQ78073.1 calcium binding and coiled-coil (CALCOCO1)-like domain-containing protein [Purpureocillium lilacinum]